MHSESRMYGMGRLHLFLLTFHLDKESTKIILNSDYKEEGGLVELTRVLKGSCSELQNLNLELTYHALSRISSYR